ncbi:tRNA lysidine(34) synthetase TilS [Aquibacillus kalidii]|uniref:tRNA lysidine(34) synthetase TilS n=1 Tax=Aquibacillus kalidii TaxID=2762597 RepID=UPI0016477D18|nr:tRNA lysidine(34) synthetase TilS [Aquibacillus kalidii]
MIQEVSDFIYKHQLLHKKSTVIVGVSGGPDSLALLHLLHTLKETWELRLIAASVDHQLRGKESEQDVEFVKSICKQWEIEFVETKVDVKTYKKESSVGTQQAARELRYQYFREQMEVFQADYLALGHHGDDQAETLVMRLTRGTNPDGLKGIPMKREFANGHIIRPFLSVTRVAIEEYCKNNDLTPRIDPSNSEDSYTRNFYRIHVLPLLKQQNPNLISNLFRLSQTITHDELYLNLEAEKVLKQAVTFSSDTKEASLDLHPFSKYPIALQRRAFHLILNYLYHTMPDGLSYVHEDQFFEIIHNSKPNVTIDLPSQLKMSKAYDFVHFYFVKFESEVKAFHLPLQVPGSCQLLDGSKLTATVTSNPDKNTKYLMSFAIDETFAFPLIIRYRKPGDKIRVKGLNGRKKVKDIFIDEKIPLSQRDTWPIVVDQKGNIVWIIGLKKGIVTDRDIASSNFLQLHYIKGNM